MVRQDPQRLRPFLVQPTVSPLDTFTQTSKAIQQDEEGYETVAPKAQQFLEMLAKIGRQNQDVENKRIEEIGTQIGTRVAAGEDYNKVVAEYLKSGKTPRQLRADLAKATTAADASKMENIFFLRKFEEALVRGRASEAEAAIMTRMPEVVEAIEDMLAMGGDNPKEFAEMAADYRVAKILEEEQSDLFGNLSEYGSTLATQVLSDKIAKIKAAAVQEAETRATRSIVENNSEVVFSHLSSITAKVTEDPANDIDVTESMETMIPYLTEYWDNGLETGTKEERLAAYTALFESLGRQIQVDIKDFDDQIEAIETLRDMFLDAKSGSNNQIVAPASKAMIELQKSADAFLDESKREKAYARGEHDTTAEENKNRAQELFANYRTSDLGGLAFEDMSPEQRAEVEDLRLSAYEEAPAIGERFDRSINEHFSRRRSERTARKETEEPTEEQARLLGTIAGDPGSIFQLGFNGNNDEEFLSRFHSEQQGQVARILAEEKQRRRDFVAKFTSSSGRLAQAVTQASKGLAPPLEPGDPEAVISSGELALSIAALVEEQDLPDIVQRYQAGSIDQAEFQAELTRKIEEKVRKYSTVNTKTFTPERQRELIEAAEETQGELRALPRGVAYQSLGAGEVALDLPDMDVRDLDGFTEKIPVVRSFLGSGEISVTLSKKAQSGYLGLLMRGEEEISRTFLQSTRGDKQEAQEGLDFVKEQFTEEEQKQHRKQLFAYLEGSFLVDIIENQNIYDADFGTVTAASVEELEALLVGMTPGKDDDFLQGMDMKLMLLKNSDVLPNLIFQEDGTIQYDLSRAPISIFMPPKQLTPSEVSTLKNQMGMRQDESTDIFTQRRSEELYKLLASKTVVEDGNRIAVYNPFEGEQAAARNPVARQIQNASERLFNIRFGRDFNPLELEDRVQFGMIYRTFQTAELNRNVQ